MYKYVSPELKVIVFDDVESVFAASSDPTVTESTKQKVTGAGSGIILPDDEW